MSALKGELAKLGRGSIINMVGLGVGAAMNFTLLVVVTRGLGAAGAGLFLQAVAILMIVKGVATLGSDVGVVWAIPRYIAAGRYTDIRVALAAGSLPVIGLSLVLGASLVIFAAPIASLISDGAPASSLVTYLRIAGPFLPFLAISTVLVAGTRGFETMVPTLLIEEILVKTLRAVMGALAIALGLGAVALGLAWVLPAALALVVALGSLSQLQRRLTEATPSWNANGSRSPSAVWNEIWRFSAPRGLAKIFEEMVMWLDVVLVGALVSPVAAAIYAVASRCVKTSMLPLSAIQTSVAPQLSRLIGQRDQHDARYVFRSSAAWSVIAVWPALIALAVFAPVVMQIFGSAFVEGTVALRILAIGTMIVVACGPSRTVLLMAGKSNLNLVNAAAALMLNVVLNLMLIPRFGIGGAAVAWVITMLVERWLPVLQLHSILRLDPIGAGVAAGAVAALASYGIPSWLAAGALGISTTSLVVAGLWGTALYLVLVARLRELLRLPTPSELVMESFGRPETRIEESV